MVVIKTDQGLTLTFLPEVWVVRNQEILVQIFWLIKQDSDGYDRPRRAPFAYDLRSAYEREGDSIKDKTIKLPEMKKQGYGIRSTKPLKTKPKPQERTKPSTNAKQSQLDQERPHLKYLPL